MNERNRRIVLRVASSCLCFPDDDVIAAVPTLRAALSDTTGTAGLEEFLTHLAEGAPDVRRQEYVDLFDLSRKQTLDLSYWTDGDTRRRGETLAIFKRVYRDSGFLVELHGELPDHLAIVTEFAAFAPRAGTTLLQKYRAPLELIRLALAERGSPYAGVVSAVCGVLPGPSPRDRTEAYAMAPPPPKVELVGLDGYGGGRR